MGPNGTVSDFPEDIPVTMDEHVQKAVDCYNAGATVLHIHVRELDGKGSKRLSKFNELLGLLREAVPDMILQVGGSISFAPEGEGADAKWLSDDTRHMLAELTPAPDQVTIAINTTQMNIMDLMSEAEYGADQPRPNPATYHAYREMVVPAGPEWVEEHLRRLTAAGIQPHFQLTCMPDLETLERLVRRGHYKGPLNLTWVGIGGGFDGPNPNNFMEFIRRAPDGSTVTLGIGDAQRPAGQRHGDVHGHACALRQRGHALRPARQQDDLGRSRSSSSSASPSELGREIATGQGSARNLQDRRAVQQRRRDAGPAGHGAEPRAGPARAAEPVRRMTMRRPNASIRLPAAMPGWSSR